MSDRRWFVGLDVHQSATWAAALDPDSGELRRRRLAGPPEAAVALLGELEGSVVAVYEAGPTGYGLVRAAEREGICVRVCAPGLVARKPAERRKTDVRDAEHLARQLAAGALSFCRVPTEDEERLRDLVRAREDVRGDLMRARHRLSKLLLRRGVRYPGPLGAWSVPHLRWLERLQFPDLASRAVFGDYLAAVQGLLQRRSTLDGVLGELAATGPWDEPIARLRCFRGIDTLSAAGLVAEVGDFGRFARPGQLADYLGLVPAEHTSAGRRRTGAITKAGPPHSRRLLVEAAWHYRHPPRIGALLERRQRGADPRVCQVAWRAQRRLHTRWARLGAERHKPGGVVAVACARELCAFLWEAALID